MALRQVRSLGIAWPLIGGDVLAGIENSGSLAEGMWISASYLPDRAGEKNAACVDLEDFTEDGTENYRSVGVMFRFGAFRFLDLGYLSGNTLTGLACPKNLLGTLSAFLIAHHGDYDSNVPALYAALRPQVAIMNNGVTKGGAPEPTRGARLRCPRGTRRPGVRGRHW